MVGCFVEHWNEKQCKLVECKCACILFVCDVLYFVLIICNRICTYLGLMGSVSVFLIVWPAHFDYLCLCL